MKRMMLDLEMREDSFIWRSMVYGWLRNGCKSALGGETEVLWEQAKSDGLDSVIPEKQQSLAYLLFVDEIKRARIGVETIVGVLAKRAAKTPHTGDLMSGIRQAYEEMVESHPRFKLLNHEYGFYFFELIYRENLLER